MKILGSKTLVAVAVMIVTGASWGYCGATTGEEVSDWNDTTEGTSIPTITEADAVTVSFAAVSSKKIPPPGGANLDADIAVSGGAFVGDYSQVDGISCIAKRDLSVDPGVNVEIWLYAESGNIYEKQLTPTEYESGLMTAALGEWAACNIPLDKTGWVRGGVEPDQSTWDAELAAVQMLRIKVTRQGSLAQAVSIGDFRLVGDGFISDPAILTAIQAHFDTDASNADQLTADQLAQDSDRDGVSDLEALEAGLDPGVAIEIVSVDGDQVTLSWPVVRDKTYRLEKSGPIEAGFDTPETVKSIGEAITATAAGTEVLTYTETGAGPHFYRVIKQ
jgi:hypothetical protein